MIHLHEVRDQDKYYKINPLKNMKIEDNGSGKNQLNLGDLGSEIYTFELPRVVEGHDMTLCNLVEVHYINASKTDKSEDVYKVTDLAPAEDDTDTIVFSWKVGGTATKYSGTLNFRIKFACIDENGNYTYRKWTEVYKGIIVGDGFDNGEAVEQQYSDILSQWEARPDALEKNICPGPDCSAVSAEEMTEMWLELRTLRRSVRRDSKKGLIKYMVYITT